MFVRFYFLVAPKDLRLTSEFSGNLYGFPIFLIKFVFVLLLREGLSGKGIRLYAQVFVLDIVGSHVYGFSVAEGSVLFPFRCVCVFP